MAVKKKVVEIETKQAERSVKSLREELKQLKSAMLSAEEGSEEYNKALVRSAEIQHTLKEQMEEINASAMDFGQISSNLVKTTGGLVAGFQSVIGVMNLFGIENQNVIELMQKMQSLMAITQALPSIDSGIKAFRRLGLAIKGAAASMNTLKVALISTGIGAAVAAVGLLAANWDKVTKALKGNNEELERQKNLDIQGRIKAENDELQRQINLQTQLTKLLGGNDIQVAITIERLYAKAVEDATKAVEEQQNKVNELQTEYNNTSYAVQNWGKKSRQKDAIQEATNNLTELQNQLIAVQDKYKKAGEAVEDAKILEAAKKQTEAAKSATDALQKLADAYVNLVTEIDNYNKSQRQIELDKLNKEEQERIAIIQKAEKDSTLAEQRIQAVREHYAKERAKIEQKTQLDSLKLMEDNYKLQDAALKASLDSQEIDIVTFNERKKELDETYKDDYVKMLEDLLKDETLNTEQRLALYQKLNAFRNPSTTDTSTGAIQTEDKTLSQQISDAINASALALNDFSDNPAWSKVLQNISLIAANWDTMNAQLKGSWDETFQAVASIAATGLGAVAAMLNGLAAEQDATNKEGFESQKKLQVAGATMNMLAGIASAWASSMQLPFPANVAIGAILSTMMTGIGIAQILKIKKQQFGGSGNVSGAGASPSTAGMTSLIAPVQYTQDVQGANIEGAIKDTRVYVTEADISNTQKRVNVAESENRY